MIIPDGKGSEKCKPYCHPDMKGPENAILEQDTKPQFQENVICRLMAIWWHTKEFSPNVHVM